ncbi:MAG: Hsp20/alpha crystallin family protein [Victivallaceae bacterium]|nr:Hsp20/alpha crystallin family protein [Victivallaceae bacterium]
MAVPQKVSEYLDFAPPADVIENPAGLKLVLDVPGACKDGLNINVESGELNLTADTCVKRGDKAVRYKRTFQLSDQIDVQNIKAKLENGVLNLMLPKHEHARVHRVKIEA